MRDLHTDVDEIMKFLGFWNVIEGVRRVGTEKVKEYRAFCETYFGAQVAQSDRNWGTQLFFHSVMVGLVFAVGACNPAVSQRRQDFSECLSQVATDGTVMSPSDVVRCGRFYLASRHILDSGHSHEKVLLAALDRVVIPEDPDNVARCVRSFISPYRPTRKVDDYETDEFDKSPTSAEDSVDTTTPRVPPDAKGICRKESVRSTMSTRTAIYKKCYQFALKRDPELRGRMILRFIIESTGRVGCAEIAESTLHDDYMEQCVAAVTRRTVFEAPNGGRCVVRWPFSFKPR